MSAFGYNKSSFGSYQFSNPMFSPLVTSVASHAPHATHANHAPVAPVAPIQSSNNLRITLDCTGYSPKSIKTDVIGNKITVTAREEDRQSSDNYTIKEFKRSYDLPKNADIEKLQSFISPGGQLYIEVPVKIPKYEEQLPKIIDDGKSFSMIYTIPDYIDSSKITVSNKDREVIIKSEDKLSEMKLDEKNFIYFKRFSLPENVDFNQISCNLEKNKLTITAPLRVEIRPSYRKIPIQTKSLSPNHHSPKILTITKVPITKSSSPETPTNLKISELP
jgi:HSP20 family molecular chaperone IbpA